MEDKIKELQTQKTLKITEEYLEKEKILCNNIYEWLMLSEMLEKEKKLCDNMRDPIFIWNLLGLADSGTRRKYLG